MMPAGWDRARDSQGVFFVSPEQIDVERCYRVRWLGAHHDGLYVEGYDWAVVIPRAVLEAVLVTVGMKLDRESEAR